MIPAEIIQHLESNWLVFESLLKGKEPDEYNFRPDAKSWSLLEIICHLFDEEREDFRTRVRNTLESPQLNPPSIDPSRWVIERKYVEQDYEKKIEAFLLERTSSIEWLRSLVNPPWDNVWDHPQLGKFTAYKFLVNWLAHDYHHIRQINRRMYEYLKSTGGVSLNYAGEW